MPLREGTLDRADALRMLRCSPEVFDRLVAAGLSAAVERGEPRFDRMDLFNLGLYSGSGRSLPELAIGFLARVAREGVEAWTQPRRWRAEVELRCPRGEGCAGGGWRFGRPSPELLGGTLVDLDLPPGCEADDREVRSPGPGRSFDFAAELISRGRALEVRAGALRDAYLETVDRFRFQITPRGLKHSAEQVRQRGATDCDGLGMVLAEACERAGHEARLESGFMLGPFGFGHHSWVRVRDADGEWKALDPALPMVAALGGGDTDAFREFCCGSELNRITACTAPDGYLAHHRCGEEELAPELVIKVRALAADSRDG